MKSKCFIQIFLGILLLLSTGCGDKASSIPIMPVSMRLNLLGDDLVLQAYGTYKTYTKVSTGLESLGFGGILVVHSNIDGEYYAFDLACPYEADKTIKIEIQPELTAKCPECGSVYRIMDGNGWRISGPSKEKLKRYNVYPAANNYLYITN